MRWTVAFVWGLCACQIVGPRPPMVHDGMPPEAFKSAQFILVKGELLEQQVAVVGGQGSVRDVTVGDVRAKFERLEGDEIIVQGPRGLMSTELSEVTAVTFTGPEIRRWKADRWSSQVRKKTRWGLAASPSICVCPSASSSFAFARIERRSS